MRGVHTKDHLDLIIFEKVNMYINDVSMWWFRICHLLSVSEEFLQVWPSWEMV